MRLIKPSFEIIEQDYTLNGIYKIIEQAGRTCYSEDTEVLTNKGWKFFPNVDKDDLVLSYNPINNSLIWDTPNMFTKTIIDNMIEINHNNIKLCVTRDHRILQSTPLDRNYSFLTAEQLLGISPIPGSKQSRFRIPKYFIGAKRTEIEIPTIRHTKEVKHGFRDSTMETIEFTVNPSFMVIAGAFISEGHTNHREKYRSGSNCQITQDCNTLLYENVIEALDNLQWKYHVSSDPRKPNIKWITFGNSVLVDLFDSLFGKGSKNKHLPEWFRKLPDEYLQILIENLYLGDGSHNITRKERYISISRRLLDEIQEVFILLGKNASYTFDEDISQKCTLEESTRDSWIVDRKKHIKMIECKERTVYCTSTKSGIICVRYKGKTCWCGNCYKSEDKITETSAKEFVDRMIKSGHGAMLEHGTVYLKVPKTDTAYVVGMKYERNKYSKSNYVSGDFHITTNLRAIVENGWMDDLQYLCEPTEYHEKRYTVKFTTDQGILREFTRHRSMSFAVESTRYCNYSKSKFNNEITFIQPCWLPDGDNSVHAENIFVNSLCKAEKDYFELLKEGWKPQQARNVLPLATKCDMIMTGFASDWNSFFNLRTPQNAHPQARELAIPLKEEFLKRGYI